MTTQTVSLITTVVKRLNTGINGIKMPTKLDEWIRRKQLTNKLFSKLIADEMKLDSFSDRTVEQWRAGRVVPREWAQKIIYRITGGEISPNDFIKLPPV